jgi:long-chain acyl-CoA synthetase
VPLSHANIVFEIDALRSANLVSEHDRALLPLPGHHVYPLVVGILTPLALGVPIVLPHSLTGPQIQRALKEGEATIVIGVPRFYEALVTGIETQASSRGWVASAVFRGMHSVTSRLPRAVACKAGQWIFRRLHKKIGPKLRVLASGGSPLDPQLARRLEALGWQVAIGYGLTETSPLATMNPPGAGKLESVGRAVPGVEIRIDRAARPGSNSAESDDDPRGEGEILIRGPNLFAGYYHLPDKTDEAFTDDGWFRTGDLGYLDDDGYLFVTGRVSTVIVTKSGKNVQPDEVEESYAKSPAIREMGILEEDGELVAVVVPETDVVRQAKEGDGDLSAAVRKAIEEGSGKLPSYQRVSDFAISRESLPRTRLGKIQRHKLAELYERARRGEAEEPAAEPLAIEEMSAEDRTLLEDHAARDTWNLLAAKYPDQHLTPDTDMHLDLGIDSMEWLNLSLEIRERAGVELDDEAIGRVASVRDLLREVTAGRSVSSEAGKDILDEPEQALSERQKKYLEPHGRFRAALARGGFAANRSLMSLAFGLDVKGAEHLPADEFIITPNHASYLDPFVVAAALDWPRLERVYWGGFTGAAFTNPLTHAASRLAKVIPVDPRRGAISSLAFAASVLKRGNSLVWFPEGQRSNDGKLQDFKPGIGVLLTHYPVTIVPVWIDGAFKALPMGKILPRFRKITVTFGEPIDARELVAAADGNKQEAPDEEQQRYERIAKELRKRVAQLAS